MKHQPSILLLFVILLTASLSLQANPFACKMKQQSIRQIGKQMTSLAYVGYANMENQKFAIIQLDKNQYILKKGETIRDIKIIRFNADSLVYRENGNIFSIFIHPESP